MGMCRAGMNQPLCDFVDSAVSAKHQNQIRAVGDSPTRHFPGLVRAGRGEQRRNQSAAGQRGFGTLENSLGIAPEFASGRVVDQNRLAERCDLTIITLPTLCA